MSGKGYIVNQPSDYVGKGLFPLRVDSTESFLQRVPVGIGKGVPLVDVATIATNAALGDAFTVTLAASRAMGAPTNPTDCQKILYLLTQGGAGSYGITWDAAFLFGTDLPTPVLSTAVGKSDLLGFMYFSALSKWLFISCIRGF